MSDILQAVDQWLTYSFRAPWSALLIYGLFGLVSLFLAWVRFRWYRKIQNERSVLIFAITNFFQGLAFIGAALITADHPVRDFRFLLPWVRIAWLCTLICFMYGTHTVYWKLNEIEQNRAR